MTRIFNKIKSNKITKIAFDNRLDYKIRKGRPRLGWVDDLLKDLKHVGISGWR